MARGERLEQIQLLRGLAALAVFVFHLGVTLDPFTPAELRPLVRWGNIGVDLFFVISGFVMAHSVRGSAGPSAAGTFLARRFWRIAPLLYIVTVITLWAALARGQSYDLARIVNGFTILPLMHSPHQYQHALIVAWTLAYEVAFYLIVAAVVALQLRPHLLAIAVIIAILTLVAPVRPFSDTLMIEFAFGVGAYALWRRTAIPPGAAWLALGGAALLFAFPLGEIRLMSFGLPSALLFIAALAWRPSGMLLRVGTWLGTISYSMYLSHTIAFGLLKPAAAIVPLAASAILLAGFGILMSWLVYEAAEAPLQRLEPRRRIARAAQAAA